MQLEEKVGQLLMFGFSGWKPPKDTGGIIIFERNVRLRKKFFTQTSIPQFVAIDQEGGIINRIVRGVTILPPAADVKTVQQAYKRGVVLAKELMPLGINMDLSPVADVMTEYGNSVIGTRSFGSNPINTARLTSAQIQGMQENNLMACAKHFPGHGPAKSNSHLCLPRVNISIREWKKVHLVPFISAVRAGVKAIMVGHILYTVLDKKYPASLSYKVITGWLRNRLGYNGLIITDSLNMSAITRHYAPADAAVMAVEAGADMVIVTKGIRIQKTVRNALITAVKNKRITRKRLDKSVNKILKLKTELTRISHRIT